MDCFTGSVAGLFPDLAMAASAAGDPAPASGGSAGQAAARREDDGKSPATAIRGVDAGERPPHNGHAGEDKAGRLHVLLKRLSGADASRKRVLSLREKKINGHAGDSMSSACRGLETAA